jgi:hypothetical protein
MSKFFVKNLLITYPKKSHNKKLDKVILHGYITHFEALLY